MKDNKLYRIVIFFLLLLVAVLCFFLLKKENPQELLNKDETAVEWTGKQDITKNNNTKGIAIPGFDLLVLKANSLEQKVNLYNPDLNDCLFLMTLNVDGKELWTSGYISPGDGYYDIKLSETLSIGTYDGFLRIQCFKEDSTELNSAVVNFEVEVQ